MARHSTLMRPWPVALPYLPIKVPACPLRVQLQQTMALAAFVCFHVFLPLSPS